MLQCAACGHENPDVNRFCGMCGGLLERRKKAPAMVVPFPRAEHAAPETGTAESSTVKPAELDAAQPEVPVVRHAPEQAFFERTPERATDNRVAPRDAALTEAPPAVLREPDVTRRKEPERVPAPVTREREAVSAGSSSIFGDLSPAEESPSGFEAEPVRESEPLSGPSILGLSAGGDGDYLLDEEPQRHTGRNWLLLILVIGLGVLLFLQWQGGGRFGLRAALDAIMSRATAEQPASQTAQSAPVATTTQTPQSDQHPAAAPTTSDDEKSAQPSDEKTATNDAAKADAKQAESKPADVGSDDATKAGAVAEKQKPEEATEQAAAEDTKPGKKPAAVVAPPKPAEAPGTKLYARAQSELSAHNCDQAVVYFRASADAGNAAAASKLGAMYATGNCVATDRAEAYKWISRAASQEPSNTWLARNRDMLWAQMSPQERARAR